MPTYAAPGDCLNLTNAMHGHPGPLGDSLGTDAESPGQFGHAPDGSDGAFECNIHSGGHRKPYLPPCQAILPETVGKPSLHNMAMGGARSTIGSRIRECRDELGWSQSGLAVRLSEIEGPPVLTREAVSQWESDGTAPGPDRLKNLAKLLGVRLLWLWAGEGQKRDAPDPDKPPFRQARSSGFREETEHLTRIRRNKSR